MRSCSQIEMYKTSLRYTLKMKNSIVKQSAVEADWTTTN